MHWPGVVRVSIALLLGVLLVVLVATSEVIARRGWWVFTTEFVLPTFVGVAGTAVAAAAWLSSRRAAEIAEAALDAETVRATEAANEAAREERRRLAKDVDAWMSDVVAEGIDDPGNESTAIVRGLALRGEVQMHSGTSELASALFAAWRAIRDLRVQDGEDGTVSSSTGDAMFKTQYKLRDLLVTWIEDPEVGSAKLAAFSAEHPPDASSAESD